MTPRTFFVLCAEEGDGFHPLSEDVCRNPFKETLREAVEATMENDDRQYATIVRMEVIDDATLERVRVSIEGKDCPEFPKEPVIPAEAWTDDHKIEVKFDALEWFKQANDEEIRNLAGCEWSLDEPADEVAIWTADNAYQDGLCKLFWYTSNIAGGFECRVDEEKARQWLKKERPATHTLICMDEDGEYKCPVCGEHCLGTCILG